jgi:hypothetical protein
MFIPDPDPDFCPSRLSDPKLAIKEKDEKNLVILAFYVATIITFEQVKKNFGPIYKEL